jgi:hypothetical protein
MRLSESGALAGYGYIIPSGIAACCLQKEDQVVYNFAEMWIRCYIVRFLLNRKLYRLLSYQCSASY